VLGCGWLLRPISTDTPQGPELTFLAAYGSRQLGTCSRPHGLEPSVSVISDHAPRISLCLGSFLIWLTDSGKVAICKARVQCVTPRAIPFSFTADAPSTFCESREYSVLLAKRKGRTM
jgi:hypothetical protein